MSASNLGTSQCRKVGKRNQQRWEKSLFSEDMIMYVKKTSKDSVNYKIIIKLTKSQNTTSKSKSTIFHKSHYVIGSKKQQIYQ